MAHATLTCKKQHWAARNSLGMCLQVHLQHQNAVCLSQTWCASGGSAADLSHHFRASLRVACVGTLAASVTSNKPYKGATLNMIAEAAAVRKYSSFSSFGHQVPGSSVHFTRLVAPACPGCCLNARLSLLKALHCKTARHHIAEHAGAKHRKAVPRSLHSTD